MKAYGRPIDLKFDFVQFFRKTRVRFWPCSAEHPVLNDCLVVQFLISANSLSLSSLSVNLLLILCGSKLVEQIGVYLNNLLHAFTQACLLNSEVSCRAKPLDVLNNPLDVRNSAHDLQPSYPSYRSLLDDRVLYTYSPTPAYLKTTHTSVFTRSYTYFLIRLHELHRPPS